MDIRIEGLHEEALLRLMQRNNEKTGVGMARILIRDAAKQSGVWPSDIWPTEEKQPVGNNPVK